MNSIKANILTWISAILAALIVLTTSIYAINSSTSVPYWDMFDGNLDFYWKFSEGDWGALWQQHNEHRIVLAKLLFLIDFSLARGTTTFLHVMNLVLASMCGIVMILFARDTMKVDWFSTMPLVIIGLSFSIQQKENFTNAFQSQFFLASLLPLVGLYFAHRSVKQQKGTSRNFALAASMGLASSLAMANGILALPVLTVYALLMRMSWTRIAVLSGLSLATISIYFYGHHSIPGHTPILDSLQKPFELLRYVVIYMGHNSLLGFIVLVAEVAALFIFMPRGRAASGEIALVGFVGFVIMTGAITGLGRLHFGLEQARSSRYLTPVFAAYGSLIILYAPSFLNWTVGQGWLSKTNPKVLGVIALTVLAVGQGPALRVMPERNYNHMLGALALELGLADQATVNSIYPNAEHALKKSTQARTTPLMIWAMEPIRNARTLIGTTMSMPASTACHLAADKVTPISTSDEMLRVDGWLGLPSERETLVYLTDEVGKIYGVGLIGRNREEVRKVYPDLDQYRGFSLYALTALPDAKLYIGTDKARCPLPKIGTSG
ncbi:MAG: hypothetical protein ACI9O0_000301 [Paracoccaceae bacterium]|jgi:hypothetical protein